MRDRLGREIEYLRLSITQNCDLNCIYCRPLGDVREVNPCQELTSVAPCQELTSVTPCQELTPVIPCRGLTAVNQCQELTADEMERFVVSVANLGVKKVRITGGEPLVREDVCEIISKISRIPQIEDISMTTNGIHLDRMAEALKQAGLQRINISLDSLQNRRFEYITGGGRLPDTLRGIEKAIKVGLNPVKINTVLIKGINEDEVEEFFHLAKDYPIEVRFIELMPVGSFGEKNRDKTVWNSDIIAAHPELQAVNGSFQNGSAEIFTIAGYMGRIGFISPMSHKFCESCNRIRLTCDGKIIPCLGSNEEFDITGILRDSPEKLDETIEKIIFHKPKEHGFNQAFISKRGMNEIGG
jgi:cyclic pyranopterin phosphate synthase